MVQNISAYELPKNAESFDTPGMMFCAKKDAFYDFSDDAIRGKIKNKFPNLRFRAFWDAHLAHQHHPRELATRIKEHYKRLGLAS